MKLSECQCMALRKHELRGLGELGFSPLDIISVGAKLIGSGSKGGDSGGAPSAMPMNIPITVSPQISTEVSPQISPVFQQSFQPSGSPMTAGTQMAPREIGTAGAPAFPRSFPAETVFQDIPAPSQLRQYLPYILGGGALLVALAVFMRRKSRAIGT